MFDLNHRISDIRTRIVMCPYAGGNAQSYFKYLTKKQDLYSITLIEYSGHGARFRTPLASDFQEMVEDVEKQLKALQDTSIVLFGHSLGGMVVAYSAMRIYSDWGERLKGIIISSCLPPAEFARINKQSVMQKEELFEYLQLVRNIPRDVINSGEFQRYLMPIIENDFRIVHTFTDKSFLTLPPCPVFCIYGEQDYGIGKQEMEGWNRYSQSLIHMHSVPGSHFYFEEHPEKTVMVLKEIINIINREENGIE